MDPQLEELVAERHGLAIEVDRLQAMLRVGGKGRYLRIIALTYGTGGSKEFYVERKHRAIEEQVQERLFRMRAVDATILAFRRQ